jgi:phosphate transport system permease protein
MNFPARTAPLEAMRSRLQRKRKAINAIALTASLGAMAFGLFWLVWILWTTVHLGIGGLSLQLFTR